MTTIVSGSPATFVVAVQVDGKVVPVIGPVSLRIFSMNGKQSYVTARDLAAPTNTMAPGAVQVVLTELETQAVPHGDALLVLSGSFGVRRYRITSESLFQPTQSSLFIKDVVVDELRKDRLSAAAAGILQGIEVTDQYLWDKVRAAESEISHALRVPLVPTRYFPVAPTEEEIDALDGMPWELEPGYDFENNMFEADRWGYLVTRQRPIISVEYMRFAYPTQTVGYFELPLDWLRIDQRIGHLRIVPSSTAAMLTVGGFTLAALTGRRTIPSMVQVKYTAGLQNVQDTYPELLDLIKKKAVLKIVADAFLPQSGSISADGLSESMSVDMTKYSDACDEILNGPPGTNGGLMTKIHGIRVMVA